MNLCKGLKDNPGTAENDTASNPNHIADQATFQAAETAKSHTYNDPQLANKEALHLTTKTAFIPAQLNITQRKFQP